MPRPSDDQYLREVERLANTVCDAAHDEGWLAYDDEPDDATPLQRAVNELARNLRSIHSEDDGCVEAIDDEENRSG